MFYRWLVAIVVGMALAGSARADFTFVHISDLLFTASAYEASSAQKNAAMLKEISGLTPRPAFAIATGNMTQSGAAVDFALARKTIQEALLAPLYAIPGNQDIRWNPAGKDGFVQALQQPLYRSFDREGLHFVLLDSTVALQHWGHFGRQQLDWLREDLKKAGRVRPVVVAFHHPIGWQGPGQVDNERELLDVLAPYNIRLFLIGHGMTQAVWSIGGIPAIMCPGLSEGAYHLIQVTNETIEVQRRTPEEPEPHTLLRLSRQRSTTPAWEGRVKVAEGRGVVTVTRNDLAPQATLVFRLNEGPEVEMEATPEGWQGAFPARTLSPGTHLVRIIARLPDGRSYTLPLDLTLRGSRAIAPHWQTGLGAEVQARLTADGERVYAATLAGIVIALETASGKTLWTTRCEGAILGAPCLADGVLYVATVGRQVSAVEAATGKVRWKASVGGALFAGPAVSDGVVAVAAADRTIYGLSVESGKTLWSVAAEGPFQSRIGAAEGRFFLGGWDGYFRCLDARGGQEIWKRKLGETPQRASAVGAPALAEGKAFVTCVDGSIQALDLATGETLWKKPDLGVGYAAPLVREGKVYCTSVEAGRVYCLDAATGAERWNVATGARIFDASATLAGGALFLGGVDGTFSALRASDGAPLWRFRLTPGHVLATPAADASQVYVGSLNGTLFAFPLAAPLP